MSAAEIAAVLGTGHPDGKGSYRCDCPLCGGHNLVLSDGRRRLLVKCWNGCAQKDVLDELRHRGVYGSNGHDPAPPETAAEHREKVAEAKRETTKRTVNARDIWDTARPAKDTLAEVYFGSRQIMLPIPDTLRLANSVFRPKSRDRRPHIVGLIEHQDKGPIGISLIALNPLDASAKMTGDDRKWTKGPRAGGAVRLFPAGSVLALSEGIEDALSFTQESGIPAWAAITADGMRSFVPPTLATTQCIILIEDQDENQTGQHAVAAAAQRLTKLGYKIQICRPKTGKDLNDALCALGTSNDIFGLTDYNLDNEDDELLSPEFSDDALALRFSAEHAATARYVAPWGRWLLWEGTRWQADETLSVFTKARAICRKASTDASPKEAKVIASAKTVAAVVNLARADRRHVASIGQWDADPWLLNTPGGIVDLKTGKIEPHEPERYLSKIAACAPGGECPIWLTFLNRVTDQKPSIINFLKRVAGYCLTGLTVEHALFFFYGLGGNGKGVFIKTLTGILGDYAAVAPIAAFLANRSERHETELAKLQGARLVTAQEVEVGRRWDEAKVKALTGGDRITARFMRQDYFEFDPLFKLIIAANNKPSLRSVDEAWRRRLKMIPFDVIIPPDERDIELVEKLRQEWPGILQWAIDGCLAWQDIGLASPDAVTGATRDYLAAEDSLMQWVAERCERGPNRGALHSALYDSWKTWATAANEEVGSSKAFGKALEKHQFREAPREGGTGKKMIAGLALRDDQGILV
jgi:putative DNA primase/helicase